MSNYLDRALTGLRTLGINLLQPVPDAPVLVLLDRVAQYDTAKVTAIAAVLQQSTTFNSVVREQIAGMDISTRFMDITQSFTSIREDAAAMAGWMDDGRLDTLEKLKLSWMNLRRGSIPSRFSEIRENYLQVCKSANDQISRETVILEAYLDFRMAMKAAEVDAQQVLALAGQVLEQRTQALNEANAQVTAAETLAPAERAALELRRDEAVRALQDEDKRYQIVKDIADDLKVGYNTAEMVFARINQVHVIKERQYQRMVSFFSTNEVVLTGLAVSFTSNSGLAEATNTLNATTDGISKGLEALGSTGNTQLEAAVKASYGSTIKVDSVRALADATLSFQTDMHGLTETYRAESSNASRDIAEAVEEAKRKFAALLTKAA
ncbi:MULTISPECIES: merozoite surface protein 3b [unclassified Pseudomonas]|uniref:merozoite surface protein 3b n=1 Tax=unclassified Pseudomonas TaxID=196821 RepID=UPI000C8433C7|nr:MULTISPECIES: merozoite surface protein 3b [unclassified Pseudomonas]AUO23187.1 merozoite surface protein 3b [Pseudomonas sp. NC02]NVZ13375.1 merozoite surface protein 3b [Pseudomonas sp. IPO3775]NVZ94178.1 merozoite surface protein 3b [Pseudomonas sp. B6001]NWA77354.1 merozoite surface protein 3b [Pseudomonas sp. C8002]NWA88400.1 merozoite surface protein 3b [Pseudomonas sp. D8002]